MRASVCGLGSELCVVGARVLNGEGEGWKVAVPTT